MEPVRFISLHEAKLSPIEEGPDEVWDRRAEARWAAHPQNLLDALDRLLGKDNRLWPSCDPPIGSTHGD